MWQPWIGSDYREGGVLLLGESCYDWQDYEGGPWETPQPNHPTVIVNFVVTNFTDSAKFMQIISGALARTARPTPAQIRAGWQRLAFTNYIPITVGRGADAPKTPAMWQLALQEWPALLDTLCPSIVVVSGLTMWSRMDRTQHEVSPTVQAYDRPDGKRVMCHAHTHASWSSRSHYEAVFDQAFADAARTTY